MQIPTGDLMMVSMYIYSILVVPKLMLYAACVMVLHFVHSLTIQARLTVGLIFIYFSLLFTFVKQFNKKRLKKKSLMCWLYPRPLIDRLGYNTCFKS